MKRIIFSLSLLLNAALLVVALRPACGTSAPAVLQPQPALNAVFVYLDGWEGDTANVRFVQAFTGEKVPWPGLANPLADVTRFGFTRSVTSMPFKNPDGEPVTLRAVDYAVVIPDKQDFFFKASYLSNVPPESMEGVLTALNLLRHEKTQTGWPSAR